MGKGKILWQFVIHSSAAPYYRYTDKYRYGLKRRVSQYVLLLVHTESFVRFRVCLGNVACNWSKTYFLSDFLSWYIR